MSNLPTLVLIPGAWHKATCYDPIIDILQGTHKLRCVAITLPSTLDNPDATFKDDIDVVRKAISKETSQGRDVVVICHSYGGMVGNSAIKGFAKPQQDPVAKSGGKKDKSSSRASTGYVVGHILIASGFTITGLAFMDLFLGRPPPFWRINKETGYAELTADTRDLFYHDLPKDEGEYWVSQLTTQSLKSLFEGGRVRVRWLAARARVVPGDDRGPWQPRGGAAHQCRLRPGDGRPRGAQRAAGEPLAVSEYAQRDGRDPGGCRRGFHGAAGGGGQERG
ncbi:hypothetical protein PG989_001054 [Apiospora arundinis]